MKAINKPDQFDFSYRHGLFTIKLNKNNLYRYKKLIQQHMVRLQNHFKFLYFRE